MPCDRKIPENPGKSRKKNKKSSPPRPNHQTKGTRAAALADYDQISAIMSKYNLSRRRRWTLGRWPRTADRGLWTADLPRKLSGAAGLWTVGGWTACPAVAEPRRACRAVAERRRACRAVAERRRACRAVAERRRACRAVAERRRACRAVAERRRACRAVAERRRMDCRTFLHHFCTVFASLFYGHKSPLDR